MISIKKVVFVTVVGFSMIDLLMSKAYQKKKKNLLMSKEFQCWVLSVKSAYIKQNDHIIYIYIIGKLLCLGIIYGIIIKLIYIYIYVC